MATGDSLQVACEALGLDVEKTRERLLPSREFALALRGAANELHAYAIARRFSLVDRAHECLDQALQDPENREAVRAAVQVLSGASKQRAMRSRGVR